MHRAGRVGAKRPAEYSSASFGAQADLITSASWLFLSFFFFLFFIPHRSEGLHSVSSRDNGVPSVTAARITEHNRGHAAVMPAQAKQQEAVVVDSAVMKLARRQTLTLPPWPSQHIFPV